MADRKDVRMKHEPLGEFDDGASLAVVVKRLLEPASEVNFYCESVTECTLVRIALEDINFPLDAFEGHVFSDKDKMDIRWMQCSDQKWRAWATSERDSSGSLPAVATRRRYYLLGEWDRVDSDGKVGIFKEGRYPGKEFKYPLQDGGNPRKKDRAYIEVVEYRRKKPGDWDLGEDLSAALDNPRLVGCRLVQVGAGRGGISDG